jgi:hypothetical protein
MTKCGDSSDHSVSRQSLLSSIPWQRLNAHQEHRKQCGAGLTIAASISSSPTSARSAFRPQSFPDSPQPLLRCSSKSPCACRVELSGGKRSTKIFGSAISWQDDFRNSTNAHCFRGCMKKELFAESRAKLWFHRLVRRQRDIVR